MTSELLLPAAFAAGFFGSAHCIAMCGSIVLLFEGVGQNAKTGMARRIAYNAGRLLFYVLLGAAAGATGAVLGGGFDSALGLLRIVAAVLLIALGLNLAFDWRSLHFLESAGARIWSRISPLARHVLPISSAGHALGAGFIWGALPCGLVYTAVAIAATSGGVLQGGSVMLAFWAGTVPALLLAGTSAKGLHQWIRHRALRRVAGAVLIGFGLIALARPLLHSVDQSGMQHSRGAGEGNRTLILSLGS